MSVLPKRTALFLFFSLMCGVGIIAGVMQHDVRPVSASSCSDITEQVACGSAGCEWTLTVCANFNGEGNMATCQANGCTWDAEVSCSGFDQFSCTPSGCSWGGSNCSEFSDQGACESHAEGGAGCTWNFTACNVVFSEESGCSAQPGCSWNGSTCDGFFDTSCTGMHSFSCSGTYSPNTCSGTATTGTCGGSTCGNGNMEGPEACDDGDTEAGDGCSSSCEIESGYSCSGEPSTCTQDPVCGNGSVEAGEQCDDDNLENGDGCNSSCTIDADSHCYGSPSVCHTITYCGNTSCGLHLSNESGEYYLYGSTGYMADWSTAESNCEAIGGYLAVIENGSEQTAIASFLNYKYDIWIGATDASNEGTFSWVNGEVSGISPWHSGQPDNAGGGGGEDCVIVNESTLFAYEGNWNDAQCSREVSYLCELAVCGDGDKDPGENCDDGDLSNDDGCDSSCVEEEGWSCVGNPSVCTEDVVCGNGATEGTEQCDDGDTTSGDGCSSFCDVEPGYSCTGDPSTCAPICGNGVKTGGEACDDGDTSSGDGCSATCTVETGWDCSRDVTPSECSAVCGDGYEVGVEACDDGDMTSGDGCSSSCTVESGYSCNNATPNICATVCGDGIMTYATEQCDDGDATSGDGCSASCTQEAGYVCTNSSPSVCSSQASDSGSSSSASTGGGGGRGTTTTAPSATGRKVDVMSNGTSEPPETHPAAPGIIFSDVRSGDVALADIQLIYQRGIMSGYADASGKPKGVFGGADPLTYAQVAKIAVKIGGIEPVASGTLKNRTALGEWSEPYVRAAEKRELPAFVEVVNVHAAPSKKVVVETLLDAAGISYGGTPDAALKKAAQLGLTSSVNKRALNRRETAAIVSRLLKISD